MRISQLAERSGIPIATIKFYLREGMLPRGEAIGATRAEYGEEHLARLRLITALTAVRGLPIAHVREVLRLVDEPLDDPVETMGRAVEALPPYVERSPDYPRARAAIEALGFAYVPEFAATAQLEEAIGAVEAAGLEWDEATTLRYGEPLRLVAAEEIAPIAAMPPDDRVPYAVLGTALYEPVILALRRLAHHHALTAGEAADAREATEP